MREGVKVISGIYLKSEIYYCRSDIIWEEQKKKGRWKALKLRLCNELEAGWNKLQRDIAIGATANYIYKSGDLEARICNFCSCWSNLLVL